MEQRPSFVGRTFEAIMALIMAKKFKTPEPLQVFGISEIENSFRHFQSGRNSGKMVIEMRKHDEVKVSLHSISLYVTRCLTDLVSSDCDRNQA